jgi:hypothetical protein
MKDCFPQPKFNINSYTNGKHSLKMYFIIQRITLRMHVRGVIKTKPEYAVIFLVIGFQGWLTK